ncbi:MAG: hypothetical protein RMY28_007755 [Nostoc sp. ChiSLP01]
MQLNRLVGKGLVTPEAKINWKRSPSNYSRQQTISLKIFWYPRLMLG